LPGLITGSNGIWHTIFPGGNDVAHDERNQNV